MIDCEELLFSDVMNQKDLSLKDFEEYKELFMKAKGRRREALRHILINKCLLLCCHYAKLYAFRSKMQFNDIVGAAFEGAVIGVDNMKRDVPGLAIVSRYIKNQCAIFVDKYAGEFRRPIQKADKIPLVRAASLDEVADDFDEPMYAFMADNTFPNDYEIYDQSDRIHDCLDNLSLRQKVIITRYFGLDGNPPRSLTEIAYEYGWNARTLCTEFHRGIDKLKELCPEYDISY